MSFDIETYTVTTAQDHRDMIEDLRRDGAKRETGVVVCRDCGGKFLDARIEDGRRFVFEPSVDGEWTISRDVAKPLVGGEFVLHNCRRRK